MHSTGQAQGRQQARVKSQEKRVRKQFGMQGRNVIRALNQSSILCTKHIFHSDHFQHHQDLWRLEWKALQLIATLD
jgi:hypothetical protein